MADLDPILLDLPTPVYTNRLLLRPPKAGDGKLVNTAIKASFEELHKWMHWASKMPSIEESEIDVRKDMAQWILRKYFKFYAFVFILVNFDSLVFDSVFFLVISFHSIRFSLIHCNSF